MRKKIIITAIIFAIGVLVLIGYYSIHVKKQWRVPEKEAPKISQIKTNDILPSKKEKKIKNRKPIAKGTATTIFKRPERCQELMKKRSESTDFKGGLTPEEEDYLRDVCRIPISRSPIDTIKVLKWWSDEDGYENMMWVNIDELIGYAGLHGVELTGIIKPLKNIALNSKFPLLRERAMLVLYKMDKEKSIPLIKEILRKEVEEREITKESRSYVITKLGMILTEEEEYEYAFPYLMKASVFEISAERNDRQAIPYMYKALRDRDAFVRISSAFWLAEMGERNEDIFSTLTHFLRETHDKRHVNTMEFPYPAYRSIAVRALGLLKDKRAIPLLEMLIKDKSVVGDAEEALEAIRKEQEETK